MEINRLSLVTTDVSSEELTYPHSIVTDMALIRHAELIWDGHRVGFVCVACLGRFCLHEKALSKSFKVDLARSRGFLSPHSGQGISAHSYP